MDLPPWLWDCLDSSSEEQPVTGKVRVFAGIDQGTTGTRTNLYDTEGRFCATAYRRTTTRHPAPGWNEQDGEELLESIETTLAEAMDQVGGAELAAIGLANQGETVIAFDRQSGKSLSPAILWSDRRTSSIVEEVKGTSGQKVLERITGLPLDPYFSASKIAWMHRNIAAVREASDAGRLAVGTLDSFFIFRLSDDRVFVTDPSTASRTQLMDLQSRRFDNECAKVYDIDLRELPDIVPTVPAEGFPSRLGAPIAASICDQQAALAAIGAIHPGEIKVTYGTGCFIEANAGERVVRPMAGLMPTFGWELASGALAYAIEGGVLRLGPRLIGRSPWDWQKAFAIWTSLRPDRRQDRPCSCLPSRAWGRRGGGRPLRGSSPAFGLRPQGVNSFLPCSKASQTASAMFWRPWRRRNPSHRRSVWTVA